MRYLPGYGWREKQQNASVQGTTTQDSAFAKFVDRTSKSKGTNLVLETPARDCYPVFGFDKEFKNPNGTMRASDNPPDAFRHGFTAGMIRGTLGKLGEDIVAWISAFGETDDASGRMDRTNNIKGLEIHKVLEQGLGRTPTPREFAFRCAEEVVKRESPVRFQVTPDGVSEDGGSEGRRDRSLERIHQVCGNPRDSGGNYPKGDLDHAIGNPLAPGKTGGSKDLRDEPRPGDEGDPIHA